MDSNNSQKNLQDKHADLLDKTYTLGWLDGYSEGYDDAIEDCQNALNKLENENELLNEIMTEDNVKNISDYRKNNDAVDANSSAISGKSAPA
ncbi:hypothetical protein D3M61_11930, partial [Aliarcobacter butzleri]|uniref:hypothetical protein n=1 Tax=Aliarcobacter butzleri TaxID=28197 RepID=UPI00102E0974